MARNENQDDLIVKLDYFFDHGKKCHIVRKDGFFSNGYITQKSNGRAYTLTDDVRGDELIFVSDIATMCEYRELG